MKINALHNVQLVILHKLKTQVERVKSAMIFVTNAQVYLNVQHVKIIFTIIMEFVQIASLWNNHRLIEGNPILYLVAKKLEAFLGKKNK